MTLSLNPHPNEIIERVEEQYVGKFDATTENRIVTAFEEGVAAGVAAYGPLTPAPGDDSVDAELERVIGGLYDILSHSSATRRVGNALDAALRLREKLKAEQAQPVLDAEEWDDVAEIVAGFSKQVHTTDLGHQFVDKLRNIAKEAKLREIAETD